MLGKLPPGILERIISRYRGSPRDDVMLPACIGEDAGVFYVSEGKVAVIHTNPITASKALVGRLAIHVSANDVASTGAKPIYFTLTLLLPENYSCSDVEDIMFDADKALRELGATLIGGHTEFTSAVTRPVAVSTAIGVSSPGCIVRTSTCRAGDYIIITKTAGLEGTSVLAEDYELELIKAGVSREILFEAKKLIEKISVVKEAMILSNARLVSAMHDATEGGVLNALYEIALASRKEVLLYESKVPVHYTTRVITRKLGLNPLEILSSGVLIACIPKNYIEAAMGLLKAQGVQASVVGEARHGDPRVIVKNKHGVCRVVRECIEDPIIKMSVKLS